MSDDADCFEQPHDLCLTHDSTVMCPTGDNIPVEIKTIGTEGFTYWHRVHSNVTLAWKDVTPEMAERLKHECSLGDYKVEDHVKACVPPGLHHNRLLHNDREQAMIEGWKDANKYDDTLGQLFKATCDPKDPDVVGMLWGTDYAVKMPLGRPTERDRIVAATIIQWLGTNVGISVLEHMNRKTQYFTKRHL